MVNVQRDGVVAGIDGTLGSTLVELEALWGRRLERSVAEGRMISDHCGDGGHRPWTQQTALTGPDHAHGWADMTR